MIKKMMLLLVFVLSAIPASAAGPFVFDPGMNDQIAAKMNIPAFFTFPESAYTPATYDITPMSGLYEFRHPASAAATQPVGLHVYLTPHRNVAARLAASGFVQTGDILLTFRPEWGFQGAYPNVQMGVSHAGLALVENGTVTNIDNPLTSEYLGTLNSDHYNTAAALHIVRPRNLSNEQKTNLLGWAKRLIRSASSVYPAQLSFNKDYFSPKYTSDLAFVKAVAQIALRTNKSARADLYCSEFVWALLSLRDCDPGQPEVFAHDGVPACVKPIFVPLQMTGDYFSNQQPAPSARLGLADGPLAVINSMGLPENEKQAYIHEVFTDKPGHAQMSPGHAAVAANLKPYFSPLEGYYAGIQAGSPQAVQIMNSFNGSVKPNYSPTSYLVNTLLPEGSEERKMDLVGTVLFAD